MSLFSCAISGLELYYIEFCIEINFLQKSEGIPHYFLASDIADRSQRPFDFWSLACNVFLWQFVKWPLCHQRQNEIS